MMTDIAHQSGSLFSVPCQQRSPTAIFKNNSFQVSLLFLSSARCIKTNEAVLWTAFAQSWPNTADERLFIFPFSFSPLSRFSNIFILAVNGTFTFILGTSPTFGKPLEPVPKKEEDLTTTSLIRHLSVQFKSCPILARFPCLYRFAGRSIPFIRCQRFISECVSMINIRVNLNYLCPVL